MIKSTGATIKKRVVELYHAALHPRDTAPARPGEKAGATVCGKIIARSQTTCETSEEPACPAHAFLPAPLAWHVSVRATVGGASAPARARSSLVKV
jgi:hypothetical protein